MRTGGLITGVASFWRSACALWAAARDARLLRRMAAEEARARKHIARFEALSRQRAGPVADGLISDLDRISERLSGAGRPPSGAPLSDSPMSAPRDARAGPEGAGRRTPAPSFSLEPSRSDLRSSAPLDASQSGLRPSAPLVDASRSGVPPSAPLVDTPKKGERR